MQQHVVLWLTKNVCNGDKIIVITVLLENSLFLRQSAMIQNGGMATQRECLVNVPQYVRYYICMFGVEHCVNVSSMFVSTTSVIKPYPLDNLRAQNVKAVTNHTK